MRFLARQSRCASAVRDEGCARIHRRGCGEAARSRILPERRHPRRPRGDGAVHQPPARHAGRRRALRREPCGHDRRRRRRARRVFPCRHRAGRRGGVPRAVFCRVRELLRAFRRRLEDGSFEERRFYPRHRGARGGDYAENACTPRQLAEQPDGGHLFRRDNGKNRKTRRWRERRARRFWETSLSPFRRAVPRVRVRRRRSRARAAAYEMEHRARIVLEDAFPRRRTRRLHCAQSGDAGRGDARRRRHPHEPHARLRERTGRGAASCRKPA